MNKQCVNCPGRTDHTTAECWVRASLPDGYMPIPTAEQLADALDGVRCFHDMSAELIAPELLANLLAALSAQQSAHVSVPRELLERAMYAKDGRELIEANRELRALTGEEYDAMAGELDRVSRELSCLQSVIAEPDELNAEPASDYETLRRQYLSLRLLTNSALARNRYLCRRDDRDMRAALSVNAANVSAERDTNAMLTDLLEKAEAERDALHAEAEALRAALFGIASINPAERGIEWAKSYASDGLNGAGSELYARWLETFKEAEALRAQRNKMAENRNSILVTDVCPESRSVEEHIIDADSVRASWRLMRGYREQIEALRAENAALRESRQGVRALVEALESADEYLSDNPFNEIGSGSILHRQMKDALATYNQDT